MFNSYAEILESYMIAEESSGDDKIEINEEMRRIFDKWNMFRNSTSISFSRFGYLIEDINDAKKINASDLKKIHSLVYSDEAAIDYFIPSNDRDDVALIKKYKPLPIYAHGNGDHYCYTASGKIKEYIHDANKIFDAEYARDYNSYSEWCQKYFKKLESANESLLDINEELPKSVKIKFFNKEWNLPVEVAKYSGPINITTAKRLVLGFTKNAEEISKKMEKSFCRMCQQDLNEIGFNKTIRSYSDLQSGCPLPAFKLKPGVLYITTDHNKKTILAILGEYPINDHGWGFQYSGGSYAGLVPDSGYYL